jgi:hypothetical protein
MLARANIELAMDIRLLSIIQDAPEKMMAFERSEKLRRARGIVDYAAKAGAAAVDDLSVYANFVANEEASIVALRQKLWGSEKSPQHWSEMNIRRRAIYLKDPFEALYELEYGQLSWQVHAGLTGVVGLESNVFTLMCGRAFGIAVECYEGVLTAVICEYSLQEADPKIEDKLKYARVAPFTTDEAQRAALQRELLG